MVYSVLTHLLLKKLTVDKHKANKGIAQLAVGFIVIGMGIAATTMYSDYLVVDVEGGIWGGIWICLTGIIGIVSSKDTTKTGLLGTTLAFNIIAMIIALINGLFFYLSLMEKSCIYQYHYNYKSCNTGSAGNLFAISLVLMIVEFFLALITFVYGCRSCSGRPSQGVIIQQPYQQFATTVSHQQGQQPIYSAQPAPYQHTGQQQYIQQNIYAPQATPFQNGNYGYDMHNTEKENLVANVEPAPVSYPSAPQPYNPL